MSKMLGALIAGGLLLTFPVHAEPLSVPTYDTTTACEQTVIPKYLKLHVDLTLNDCVAEQYGNRSLAAHFWPRLTEPEQRECIRAGDIAGDYVTLFHCVSSYSQNRKSPE